MVNKLYIREIIYLIKHIQTHTKTIVKDSPLMGKNLIHTRLVPLQTPAQLCTKSLIKSLRWMISRVKNLSTRCVWRFRRWKFGYPRCKYCWPQSNAWILTEIYTTKQKTRNTGGRWSSFFRPHTTRDGRLCWTMRF